MTRSWNTYSVVFCSIVCLLVCAVGVSAQPARQWAVRVDPVRTQSVQQLRSVTGELRAVRRSMVAAEEPGRVVELVVEEGDIVDKGQLLAKLDARLVELEIARREAEIAAFEAAVGEQEADVEQRQLDIERLESALGSGAVNPTELENARIALRGAEASAAAARADVASAIAGLNEAKERLAKMTIHAPFAGAIVRKETEIGQWVASGDTVVQLLQTDVVDVYVDVPEMFISSLSENADDVRVRITALDDEILADTIAIIPAGDSLARTFPVRIRLDNESGRLRPGMSATALIPTGVKESGLTVHKDALLRDDAGSYVFASMGGQAMPVRVKRLWAVGDRVVVESPALRPDMTLVTEGNERLYPTAPLSVMNAPEQQGGGGTRSEQSTGVTEAGSDE